MKLAAFDIETRGANPEFVCGAVVSDDGSDWFDDPSRMLNHMRGLARKGYTFVAHNAEYDSTILFWKYGEDFTISFLDGMYSVGQWRYGKGKRTVPVWDSFRLAAGMPLVDVGRSIGVPKYSIPHRLSDPDDVRQDWLCEAHQSVGCLECYNVRDAEITWSYMNMLREWIAPYDLHLKKSLPSIAVGLWQSLDPGAQQSPKSETIRKFGRRAYYGGRCENFIYGNAGMVETHDIRNHYGYILQSVQLPDLAGFSYEENPRGTDLPDTGEGIVEASLFIEPQDVPPLPVNADGRTYFPVGEIDGCWPLSELRAATLRGCRVQRLRRIAYSERLTRPFATTAGVLLELRQQLRLADDPRAILPKFLINSLIGRLGLKEDHELVSFRRWHRGLTREDMDSADLESSGDALYLAKRHTFTRPAPTSNIVWAACVVGQGRIRLNAELAKAGDSLVYCDTDSVHSRERLYTGEDIPGHLVHTGSWPTSQYLGPKLYRLEDWFGNEEVRAKGIPRQFAKDFIAKGKTEYQMSLHVIDALGRGVEPMTWIDVERIGRSQPAGRTILDPGFLHNPLVSSRTAPVVFIRDGTGACMPNASL